AISEWERIAKACYAPVEAADTSGRTAAPGTPAPGCFGTEADGQEAGGPPSEAGRGRFRLSRDPAATGRRLPGLGLEAFAGSQEPRADHPRTPGSSCRAWNFAGKVYRYCHCRPCYRAYHSSVGTGITLNPTDGCPWDCFFHFVAMQTAVLRVDPVHPA